nr:MAG TPA: hypothetical protein [Ackermannviridae sp.]
MCRQIDKCIEELKDLKSIQTIPYGLLFTQERIKGNIYKSKVKRVRQTINAWLKQVESEEWKLKELGLIEDENIN